MPKPRKATVLVVDDKQANLLALAAVLESDYELLFANSGAEAITLLKARGGVDVILMDVHMPDMDGFETASRIKKLEALQNIPIIFVTAVYQDDPFVKKGYEVGGIDYFSKPFDPEILKLKVAGSCTSANRRSFCAWDASSRACSRAFRWASSSPTSTEGFARPRKKSPAS
jgi:CheY-like chemotaxis protein